MYGKQEHMRRPVKRQGVVRKKSAAKVSTTIFYADIESRL